MQEIPSYCISNQSPNLYKFRCNFDTLKQILEQLKKDQKEIFLDFRKSSFRYEFGVYDEDHNMILVTCVTD